MLAVQYLKLTKMLIIANMNHGLGSFAYANITPAAVSCPKAMLTSGTMGQVYMPE